MEEEVVEEMPRLLEPSEDEIALMIANNRLPRYMMKQFQPPEENGALVLSSIAFKAGKKVDQHLNATKSLKRHRQHYRVAVASCQVLESFMILKEEVISLRLKLLDYYMTSHSKECLALLEKLDRIIEQDQEHSMTDSTKSLLDEVVNEMTSFFASNQQQIQNVLKEMELLSCTRNLSDKKLAILQMKSCLESSTMWIPDVLVVLAEVTKANGSNDLKYFTQDLIYRTRASGKYGSFQIVYRPPPGNQVIENKSTYDQYVEKAIRVFDDHLRSIRKYASFLGQDTKPKVNDYRWYDKFEALTRTTNRGLRYFHHMCLYLYSVAMGRADPKADALRQIDRMMNEELVKYTFYQKQVHGLDESFRSDRDQMICTTFRFFPELFDFVATWRKEENYFDYPKEIEASQLIQQLCAKYGASNLVTVLVRIQEPLASSWSRTGLSNQEVVDIINLDRIGNSEKCIKYLFTDMVNVLYLLQLYRWKNVVRYRENWLMNLHIHEDKDIVKMRVSQQKDVEKAPCIEQVDASTINQWEEKVTSDMIKPKKKNKQQQERSFRAPVRCRMTQITCSSETPVDMTPMYLKDIYTWNDEKIQRHKRKGDVMGPVQRKILSARQRFSLYEVTKRRKYESGDLSDTQLAQSSTRLYSFTQQMVHEVEPFVLHMASKALTNDPSLRVKVKGTFASSQAKGQNEVVQANREDMVFTDRHGTPVEVEDTQGNIKAQRARMRDMKKVAIQSTIDVEEIFKMLQELKSVRVLEKCKVNGLSIVKSSQTLMENVINLTHLDLIATRKEVERRKAITLSKKSDAPEIVEILSDEDSSEVSSRPSDEENEEVEHEKIVELEGGEEEEEEEEMPEIIEMMSTTTDTDDSETYDVQSLDDSDLGITSDTENKDEDDGQPIKMSPHLMDYHEDPEDEEEEKEEVVEKQEPPHSMNKDTTHPNEQVVDHVTNQVTAPAVETVPVLPLLAESIVIPSESQPPIKVKQESSHPPSIKQEVSKSGGSNTPLLSPRMNLNSVLE